MEFPAEIRDFAEMFVVMQSKRHLADYDPYAEFNKSDVVRDIAETEGVIERFSGSLSSIDAPSPSTSCLNREILDPVQLCRMIVDSIIQGNAQ